MQLRLYPKQSCPPPAIPRRSARARTCLLLQPWPSLAARSTRHRATSARLRRAPSRSASMQAMRRSARLDADRGRVPACISPALAGRTVRARSTPTAGRTGRTRTAAVSRPNSSTLAVTDGATRPRTRPAAVLPAALECTGPVPAAHHPRADLSSAGDLDSLLHNVHKHFSLYRCRPPQFANCPSLTNEPLSACVSSPIPTALRYLCPSGARKSRIRKLFRTVASRFFL